MKIIDESIMTVGKVNDYCIDKVILCDKFKKFINELYRLHDGDNINKVSVAVDLSFAINDFNKRSAVSRPIREKLTLNVYNIRENLLHEQASILNPSELILIELNRDLYDITNSVKYSKDEGYYYTEAVSLNQIQITPSPLYRKIVDYFEDSTVIENC